MSHAWKLVRDGFVAFYEDNALSRGAAIAFYLVTALAPILFITVLIASLGFGEKAVQDAVGYQLRAVMSPENARILQSAIRNGYKLTEGWTGLLGGLALVITASGVFGEMEDALNAIWKAPRKGSLLTQLLHGRVRSLLLVVIMGFLFLLSMILSAGIAVLNRYLDLHTTLSELFLNGVNLGISLVVLTVMFALIYKILPNRKLEWRDVVVGSAGTALLFILGQAVLGFYLGKMRFEVAYGTAGGLIVLLIWVYYSAQVFLLGAEFTKIWACHYGSHKADAHEMLAPLYPA